MDILKILIIEDDYIIAENLAEQLVEFGYVISGIVHSSNEALPAFKKNLPDLILCDIQLKGSPLDGIEIIRHINEICRVPVIFLTAFSDGPTVEKAKSVHPSYYLLKPVNTSQLNVAIEMALHNFSDTKNVDQGLTVPIKLNQPICSLYSQNNYIFMKDGHRFIKINYSDMLYIEAMGSSVKIVSQTKNFIFSANLSQFFNQVNSSTFVRIHKSYIVNINKIESFDLGEVTILIGDRIKTLPIGRSYKDAFMNYVPKLFTN